MVIDTGGADVMTETLTALKIRFEPTSKTYMNTIGAWTQSQAYAMVINSTIKINDVIRYNSTDYPVKQIEAFNLLNGNELYRILYF
jgi:phage gp37-like protein